MFHVEHSNPSRKKGFTSYSMHCAQLIALNYILCTENRLKSGDRQKIMPFLSIDSIRVISFECKRKSRYWNTVNRAHSISLFSA